MTVYGEVAWGDVQDGGQKNDSRDSFLRLEKGSNIVRIITPPHQYNVHRYKRDGDPGFGHKIMCSKVNGACPLCALGDVAKRRWFLGVIDRKTRSYKILDVGISVFKSIQGLTRDDEWGDPSRYDLDIKVDPNGGASNYYSITPKIPKPLSADDIQIKDMVDVEGLKRLCTPPSSAKVQERMDRLFADNPVPDRNANNNRGGSGGDQRTAAAAPRQAADQSDDEDDVQFPAYEQK